MFKVWMIFGKNEHYVYGMYADRDKANEIAMKVREERSCDVYVEEVE